MSTIAILWPVKAIFEKRAATVEVDTLVFPLLKALPKESFRANFNLKRLFLIFRVI